MRRFYALLMLALILYCVVVVSTTGNIRAQGMQAEAVRQLERRVDAMDQQKLSERMARQEALMESLRAQGDTTNKLLMGVFATLALMLAERAVSGGKSHGKRRQLSMFGSAED